MVCLNNWTKSLASDISFPAIITKFRHIMNCLCQGESLTETQHPLLNIISRVRGVEGMNVRSPCQDKSYERKEAESSN